MGACKAFGTKCCGPRPCNKCKLACCAKKCVCGTKACKAFGTKCCGPRPCNKCALPCCAKKCVCGTKACKAFDTKCCGPRPCTGCKLPCWPRSASVAPRPAKPLPPPSAAPPRSERDSVANTPPLYRLALPSGRVSLM